MANYSNSDKLTLSAAMDILLRDAGLGVASYPTLMQDLLNVTSSPLTLYVESTGNDNNSGLSTSDAFLTINGALASIPKFVSHLINIKIGAGNFAGFNVEGFFINPRVIGTTVGISILGTFANATLAAGTATGTITATAAGNTQTPTFAVMTD